MKKSILWIMAGIGLLMFVIGAPSAEAIFGIRLARKAIAATRAANEASSPEAEEAAAQERAKLPGTTGYAEGSNRATEGGVSTIPKEKEPS